MSRSTRDKTAQRTRVLTEAGTSHPFLRGMVTHDLVQRGLSFNDSYAVASAIRDELSEREEVTTSELRDRIARYVEEMFPDQATALQDPDQPRLAPLEILNADGGGVPFSRGLLSRSLFAAGIDFDRAYGYALQLESELRSDGSLEVDRDELATRIAELIERQEGPEPAARYRLVRRLTSLPRPLVIYLGGASGTGKSTVSLELAPLLRIDRVIATDTIRQVMRMVFSPAILPAIHRSSFEPDASNPVVQDLLPRDGVDPADSVVAGFDEQAMRVCVGVRAVVDRALAENQSLIVEGVHLSPAMVPFSDLEGAAYQLLLTLTTLDEELHRTRFLSRASAANRRRAERYLSHFSEIRGVQDHLLRIAEQLDTPLLDTGDRETTIFRVLRLISGVLQERVPWLAAPEGVPETDDVRTLMLILDGLPDRAVRSLGGRTPVEAANLPHLDRLAREGCCGLADPVAEGVVPDTAAGTLAVLGQSPAALSRGPVEAIGAGMELAAGEIALRGNLATLDEDGIVLDRRAGRIRKRRKELASLLDGTVIDLGEDGTYRVRVAASTEHRIAVVIAGDGLSPDILGSDPGDGAPPGPPLVPRPEDERDEGATLTARVLHAFELRARELLANHPLNRKRAKDGLPVANCVLTRGAGRIHLLKPLEAGGREISWVGIGGDSTLLGLTRWLGGRAVSTRKMTANLDTDVRAKFAAVRRALKDHELVVLHLKGADIASHDRRPDLKVEFIESVDHELGQFLDGRNGRLRIVLASDHTTLSELGHHAADPVPVVLWGSGVEADTVESFGENVAIQGAMGRFPLAQLLARALDG